MATDRLELGDVVHARFPEHTPRGHEQQGTRPAVVLGSPAILGEPRYRVLLVVPLTTDRGQPWARAAPALYPPVAAGTAGLPRNSLALLDQMRFVDESRVLGYLGALRPAELEPIAAGVRALVGA